MKIATIGIAYSLAEYLGTHTFLRDLGKGVRPLSYHIRVVEPASLAGYSGSTASHLNARL